MNGDNVDIFFTISMIISAIALLMSIAVIKMNPGIKPKRDDFVGTYNGDEEYRRAASSWNDAKKAYDGLRSLTGLVSLIGLLIFTFSLWVIVPTNHISVFTDFGKPVDARTNGFQVKAPWQKAVEFDASRQYLKFDGEGNNKNAAADDKIFPCIQVKMQQEAKACVSATIGWQLRAGTKTERNQTIELYRAHKTFDRLTQNYMAANARSTTQAVYDDINPLVAEKNPSFAELSKLLMSELQKTVGSEISLISAQVVGVDYDETTDKQISTMQAEYAKTQLAKQQKITNQAVSEANAALTKDGTLNLLVLQAECVRGAIEKGHNPGVCLQPGWGGSPQQNK